MNWAIALPALSINSFSVKYADEMVDSSNVNASCFDKTEIIIILKLQWQ